MSLAPPVPSRPAEDGDWVDRAEGRLLDAGRRLAAEGVGWNRDLLRRAGEACGLTPGELALVAPQGPRDLAVLLWRRHDRDMLDALAATPASSLKVRQRIRTAVLARVEAAAADRAAVEASARFLARPGEAAMALRLGWETADAIWRWAGDTSTDANHYSKRALLWGVMAATLAARFARGQAAGEAMLDARLADVMRIEGLKGRLPPVAAGLTVAAAQLGRLRYAGPLSRR